MKQKQSVFLVALASVMVGGEMATSGTLMEVTDAEARNLLHRGKARLATDDDHAEQPDALQAPALDLTKMTKAELLEHAAALMIADADKLTKPQIIEALQARQAALAEGKDGD